MRRLISLLVVLSAVVAAPFIWMQVQSSTNVVGSACSMSLSAYSLLQPGLTYSQSVHIVGCPGVETSRSDQAGYSTAMYSWAGSGTLGANATVMFQNDKLVSKAQFGLR